jgi:hypothetical protein
MYIMVKMCKKSVINLSESTTELSILESRTHIQAVVKTNSEGLQTQSTPQRMVRCRKAEQRGLRKSSSLTNGTGPVRNKAALGEYAKGGPRSFLLPKSLSMRPSWALR